MSPSNDYPSSELILYIILGGVEHGKRATDQSVGGRLGTVVDPEPETDDDDAEGSSESPSKKVLPFLFLEKEEDLLGVGGGISTTVTTLPSLSFPFPPTTGPEGPTCPLSPST